MVDRAASASPSPSACLTDHQLARLAAAVRPLAAVNTAAGARSLFRDPRERCVHGAPPEVTPLEHGCDSGLVASARQAWQRWIALPAEARATLLWLAEHEGPTLCVPDAAVAIATARDPELAARVLWSGQRKRLAGDLAEALRRQSRKVRSDDVARAFETARQRHTEASLVHVAASAQLDALGHRLLTAANSAWFAARFDAT